MSPPPPSARPGPPPPPPPSGGYAAPPTYDPAAYAHHGVGPYPGAAYGVPVPPGDARPQAQSGEMLDLDSDAIEVLDDDSQGSSGQ
ncbi:MAG: hypothetical protein FJ095_18800 [Deltaproteobacteria bacterium]|nr:hypothetical protein [Deltaproteobacteria bacterium]